jgi:hypothetical protein
MENLPMPLMQNDVLMQHPNIAGNIARANAAGSSLFARQHDPACRINDAEAVGASALTGR